MRRLPLSLPLVLLLGLALHADWHAARPHHHRLSLEWPYHWLLALPVFAATAWYVARRWPQRLWAASLLNLGIAVLVAQQLEPLAEQAIYFHRLALGIEPARWAAFAAWFGAGLAAYLCTLWVLRSVAPGGASPAAVE